MEPKVVESTGKDVSNFPASSVLILGEKDTRMVNGKYNYWLAEHQKTSGQGFTLELDTCARLIGGFQIKNKGKGKDTNVATRKFRVAGSKKINGPWETLLEEELIDSRGGIEASLINFTFEKPVEIQFLKFELVSFWGDHGGGLQYFAAIPATSKTMILRYFCQDNI